MVTYRSPKPFLRVRVLLPLPNKNKQPMGACFLFRREKSGRTRNELQSTATCGSRRIGRKVRGTFCQARGESFYPCQTKTSSRWVLVFCLEEKKVGGRETSSNPLRPAGAGGLGERSGGPFVKREESPSTLPKNYRFRPVVFLSIAKAMVYHRRRAYIITL